MLCINLILLAHFFNTYYLEQLDSGTVVLVLNESTIPQQIHG